MNNKVFRKDINGLRAIAVLAVVIFHYNSNWLTGGFSGVDVFFVISGYLMTSIIFRGMENNNFSYKDFLYSRIKRIIPALMVLIACLLFFGFLFLEPMSYQMLGKHSFFSLLFTSNIAYWLESGYFDINSSKKLLLHTWSLSVEWQFYLIYPAILIFLKKIISLKKIKYVCFVIFLISFIVSLYISKYNPSFSYFMLPTRAWELMLGGLAFIYPLRTKNTIKQAVTLIGLVLIITSFFVVSENDFWPGYMALLPVTGTYLCILSGKNSLFSLPPLQFIGKYSYSIYLIHWSLLVIINTINVKLNFATYFILVIIFSFLLFNLIESKRKFKLTHLILFILLLGISYLISLNGLKNRVPEQFQYSTAEYHENFYGGTGYDGDGIAHEYNKNSERKIIISGDSFSRQFSNYLSNKNISFTTVFTDGCFSSENYLSIHGGEYHKSVCNQRYNNLIDAMQSNQADDVIYSQNWDSYTLKNKKNGDEVSSESVSMNIIEEIIKKGGNNRNYYIIGLPPKNDAYSYYECMSRASLPINKLIGKDSCTTHFNTEENKLNLKIKEGLKSYENVFFIDPYDALCVNQQCQLTDNNGNPIYSDSVHLSIQGADYVGKLLLDKYFN